MKQALTDGLPELVLYFPYQNRRAAMTGKPHRKKKNHNVGDFFSPLV
ncbi:MAG: hypothetical protein IJH67_11020 [Thermoguttaceae bacterium]|nr:hypothetical protein [Thermoguttaceae bacterium]